MNDIAQGVNEIHKGTWAAEVGLIIHEATRDEVTGEIEVAPRHRQPQGIVHGGVYASIIESMASIGAAVDAISQGMNVVGLENHTTFVRATRSGKLHCRALPITRGRRTQVWEVTIKNDEGAIAATGRVRLLVLDPETIP
jgi:1,4-dihydroxy-2-naphthoyl-CoA hydrolase